MPISPVYAGSRAKAADYNFVIPLSAIKNSNTQIASSSTLQNDQDLALQLPANTSWSFTGTFFYTGDAPGSGGIKLAFTVPTGAVLNWDLLYWANSSLLTAGTPSLIALSGSGTARGAVTNNVANLSARVSGSVINGANAGALQLQWAQNSSDASPTILLAGSGLAAQRAA